MRLLATAIIASIAAVTGAFIGHWAWCYFDPLAIIALEDNGGGAVPTGAWLINSAVFLPLYLPWIVAVVLLHQKLTERAGVSVGLAAASGFLIAGFYGLHPANFVVGSDLYGWPEYFATMLFTSGLLIVSSILWSKLRSVGDCKQHA